MKMNLKPIKIQLACLVAWFIGYWLLANGYFEIGATIQIVAFVLVWAITIHSYLKSRKLKREIEQKYNVKL